MRRLLSGANSLPRGGFRKSFVPLFGSYVFMCGGEEQRYRAMTTNCVSRCLVVPDSGRLVEDLRQIRRLIQADVPLTPESRIQPGTRVRVRSGSLLGVEGVVVRRQNKERLLVAVRFLQQGASLFCRRKGFSGRADLTNRIKFKRTANTAMLAYRLRGCVRPGGHHHPLKDNRVDCASFVDSPARTTMLKDGLGTTEKAWRPIWRQSGWVGDY